MSEENVDLGSDIQEPDFKLPHESIAESVSTMAEPDIVEPEPQDTPVQDVSENKWMEFNDKTGEIDVNVPEDPDEFDEFYESLTPEQRKDFDKNLADDDTDPEAAQPEGEEETDLESESPEGQEELTHEMSQKEYDSLSEGSQEYVDSLKTRLEALAQFEDKEYQAGLGKILEDPVVSNRIQQLNGKGPQVDIEKQFFSNDAIKALKLDFDFDARGSMNRLKQFVQTAVSSATGQIHDNYQSQNKQREYNTKLEDELRSIQELDSSLKSDLKYNDSNHPMSEFMGWLVKNQTSIDVLNIGGVDTYKLFLSKTGKEVHDNVTETTKKVVRNVARAKSKFARTIPKTTHSKSSSAKTIVHGIDVERFKSDEDYQERMYDQYSDSQQMIRVLNRWAFE